MDRFKFRAWDVELQGMSDSFTIQDLAYANMAGITPRFGTDNYILMQCTGLKDKHGLTLVYEGDIVNANIIEYVVPTMGEVVFLKEFSTYASRNLAGDTFLWKLDKIEIIGNIYENPELIA